MHWSQFLIHFGVEAVVITIVATIAILFNWDEAFVLSLLVYVPIFLWVLTAFYAFHRTYSTALVQVNIPFVVRYTCVVVLL